MLVNRTELLKRLKDASAGVAKQINDRVPKEQSDDVFVFHGDRIMAASDRIRVDIRGFGELDAVIPAVPLMDILRKMRDKEVALRIGEGGSMVIRGKRKECGIHCRSESAAQWKYETPRKWKRTPEGLVESLVLASSYCCDDEMSPWLSCVKVSADGIAATNNTRLYHNAISVPVKNDVFVPAEGAAKMPTEEVRAFAVRRGWFFLRTKRSVFSVRCAEGVEFPKYEGLLVKDGNKLRVPDELEQALSCTQVFDELKSPLVDIEISGRKMLVRVNNIVGWYNEKVKLNKPMPKLKFRAHPESLRHMISRNSTIWIAKDGRRLLAKRGSESFVIALCA